ncbi:GAF domain-containing protein, partial [Streptomyces nojiriensis]|uniref:GAF domain-containing protein n=1 Tax=Streptomyces nojiriensis TaxID=66374 RepID=UPI00365B6CF0
MRSPILSSWQRSRLLGLSPDQSELPFQEDFDLDGPLLRAAEPVLDRLQAIFAGSQTNICLADGHGMVLARRFGEKSMLRHLAPIQTVPGFVFAEQVAGTNGIGLSLAERRLCQVYGAEHFAERSQSSACTAIPLRDQLSGHIQGVLCLGYPYTEADPALIPVVRKAAEAIERRLMDQSSAREHGLLQAYLDTASLALSSDYGLDGHPVSMADFLHSELEQSDQTTLKEKATELMSGDRRAAAEVPLSRGRWVTLVSRPVTSAAGVEGVVVEALLPEDSERHAPAPTHPHAPAPGAAPALLPRVTPGPQPATVRAPGAPLAEGHARGRVRGLVLVGEPEVGKYAVAARRRLEWGGGGGAPPPPPPPPAAPPPPPRARARPPRGGRGSTR